jgi:hypothetical protein
MKIFICFIIFILLIIFYNLIKSYELIFASIALGDLIYLNSDNNE